VKKKNRRGRRKGGASLHLMAVVAERKETREKEKRIVMGGTYLYLPG